MRLSILYRGPLSSCNYECHYCPFAKRVDSQAQLAEDEYCLDQFVQWCEAHQGGALRVFFTPWGEAMTRHWYWRAFERLTKRPNVEKVAVQTNLSCRLDWLDRCDLKKVGLWATFHPSQISLDRFVDKIHRLHSMGVAHSVGMVGLREDFDLMETMRRRLPETTYLWINAYKSGGSGYYAREDIDRLNAIDAWFNLNNQYHPSHGLSCNTGSGVISVDGQGDVRRCHFVPTILGNLYRDSLNDILGERPCPNSTCGCHIGYVHLKHLQLDNVFADGILERIPVDYQIAMSPTNT